MTKRQQGELWLGSLREDFIDFPRSLLNSAWFCHTNGRFRLASASSDYSKLPLVEGAGDEEGLLAGRCPCSRWVLINEINLLCKEQCPGALIWQSNTCWALPHLEWNGEMGTASLSTCQCVMETTFSPGLAKYFGDAVLTSQGRNLPPCFRIVTLNCSDFA